MKHLPALLNKYVADKEKLVNLMEILMQMDVEKIGGRHDKALDALLKLLEAIVDRHADLPVFCGFFSCKLYISCRHSKAYQKYTLILYRTSHQSRPVSKRHCQLCACRW
jgi:hypothetical protein